ncbi:MAG: RAMP superfamily CRISPR-associated protein [Bacteroidales bacterium]|nr:RAMP superfamily CRISPR-associated protein [Bacteroidales bacterium]MDY0141570.1 RAMP superfamily CRISPR-associated protein [Bacteroidales bacterium]
MQNNIYTKRYLARVVLEAETPLSVGSGNIDIITDAPVARDVNGFPYLPGTSISGILRHAIGENNAKVFFGFQETAKEKAERLKQKYKPIDKLDSIDIGSKIIFTEGKMLDSKGVPIDGLQNIDWENDYFSKFKYLPIRQHVRIDAKGVAAHGAKFDEEVVYKGTRFCFEIEYVAEKDEDEANFQNVLKQLSSKTIRFGGGTRSGFGEVSIVEVKTRLIDFSKQIELNDYLEKSSSLFEMKFWENASSFEEKASDDCWLEYKLELEPEDFFLFSSGFGNENADFTPVFEDYISWENGTAFFKEKNVLIPGSSVKGALSHRTAFYYNKNRGVFVEKLETNEIEKYIGKNNVAVRTLFGSEGDKVSGKTENQYRGNVLISDIISKKEFDTKVLNHVSIDRFTGGAIDGMLFSEETIYGKGSNFELKILVNKAVFNNDYGKTIKEAFESALNDICTGMLPLGGGVNRGNGIFNGKLIKPE